jgi:hypothetical protein
MAAGERWSCLFCCDAFGIEKIVRKKMGSLTFDGLQALGCGHLKFGLPCLCARSDPCAHVVLELACPMPKVNESCIKTQFSWVLCQDLKLLGLRFLNIIIFLINIIIFIIVESINIKHIIICFLNIISSIIIKIIIFIPQIIV